MNADIKLQFLQRAQGYFLAAKLTYEYGERSSVLRAPILHMLAHGIEVLLKSAQMNVMDEAQVKKKFGHDIIKLWKTESSQLIKEKTWYYAEHHWDIARNSGKYQDAFVKDPRSVIAADLKCLAELHSPKGDFALRYIIPENTEGPRPEFLIDTFLSVSDELLRRKSRGEPW